MQTIDPACHPAHLLPPPPRHPLHRLRRSRPRRTGPSQSTAATLPPRVRRYPGTDRRTARRRRAPHPEPDTDPLRCQPALSRNHVLDGLQADLGTPPSNHSFESAPTTTGTPASNHDLETSPTAVGTQATNHDFETGDFTGWTTSGTTTIETNANQGDYAKLTGTGAEIVSSAFTVDSATQAFTVEVGWLTNPGYSWIQIYVLSGTGYTTETTIADTYCNNCGTWETLSFDASSWIGQSVKLKLKRRFGDVGVNDVQMTALFPTMTTSGSFNRVDESGDHAAKLVWGATLTTEALTLATDAQMGSIDVKGLTQFADQVQVDVLSGAGYATVTTVLGEIVPDSWTTLQFMLAAWAGESVKLRVKAAYQNVLVDDIGIQIVELPGWLVESDTEGDPEIERIDNAGDHSLRLATGSVTTAAFTLDAEAQQLQFSYRAGSASSQFDVELLHGTAYSQVTQLDTTVQTSDQVNWQTFLVAIDDFTGESVKLRIDQGFGWGEYDLVGLSESILPGWHIAGDDPVLFGEDAGGSYLTGRLAANGDGNFVVASSLISPGIIDRPFVVDQRYYAIAYDIGYRTGALIRVTWHEEGTSNNWIVYQQAANSPTGYVVDYFWLSDFTGTSGHFEVEVADDAGKFYSLADNIARVQLSEPFSEQVGYNIDTSTGAFGYQVTDIATEGLMPLQLTRYYNGHSDHVGTLGYRWTHTYDTRLVVLDNNDAGVIFGSGREVFFDWYTVINDPPNRYVAADVRNHETLVKNGDGTYTLTTTTNLDYHFDANGVLLTISDLNGNTVTVNRDGQGRVSSVTNTAGRTITLTYDGNGRLATATGPLSATVGYTYDANGDLVTINDVESDDWSYSYDAHRLASVTAPDTTVMFTNSFDDLHRVTTQTLPDSTTIQLAYDTPGLGATEVTDPESNTATYYFDENQRTTEKIDPLGNVYTSEYDSDGNVQKRINPEGEEWSFGYDTAGNRTSETDPLGNPTSYTFNPLRQPLTVTDARGKVWTNVYDSLGNLTTTTDPLNNTTTFTYNSNGNVTSETNALNDVTSYTYNSAGEQTSMTDARNKTWTWTYDAAGRLLTETNPLNETTTYTRNLFGWIKKIEDPRGNEYSFTYDIWGNLVTHTDPLNGVTTWGYDARADVVSKTDTLGKVTTYAYDDNHNMISMTDPLNQTTSWTWDDAGRLTSTTDPLNQTTTYTYDDADRLITLTDPLNRTTTYAYDDAGRLTSRTLPSTGVWSYTYDDNGNLLTETNPRNYMTTYAYDDVNRLTSMTDALSGVVSFGYDAVGNRTSLTDPNSNSWTYSYDATGNLLTETDPLSRTMTWTYDDAGRRATQTDQRSIVQTYGYDAAGNLTSVTAPGETLSFVYDAADRMTSMTDNTGTTTWTLDARSRITSVAAPQGTVSYGYDDVGQRTSMTLPSSRTVNYGYDAAGNLTSLTDWQSRTVNFTYNAANQRSGITRPNNVSTTFGYDTGGRLNSIIHANGGTTLESHSYTLDAMGNRTAVTTLAGTESYVLDALNRIASATYTNGDVVGYTYDAAGNRLTQVVNSVTTNSYTYDAAGQMTSDGTLTYTYDAAGNMTAAGTDSYTWDWRGRLASATISGTTATYSYDGMDARTSETVGGLTTSYVWDRAKGLPLLVDDGTNGYLHADGVIAQIDGSNAPTYFLTDALGSVRGLTDLTGAVVGTTTFDVFGDARTQTGATSVFDFTGEQRDTTTGMIYLRARYYEPGFGRFASEDTVVPGGDGTQGFNRFAYVGNNPCNATDPSGHSTLDTPAGKAIQIGIFVQSCQSLAMNFFLAGAALFVIGLGADGLAGRSAILLGLMFMALFVVTSILCLVIVLEMLSSALSGADGQNPNGPNGPSDPRLPNPPLPTPPLQHA